MTKCPVCGSSVDNIKAHKEDLKRTLDKEDSKSMPTCPQCGFHVEDVVEHEKQEHLRIVKR